MDQRVNQKFSPLFKEHPRYFFLMGGRGAGRSTVASQFALAKVTSDEYFRCAIMRYILGDIRNSIYREIIDRATETNTLSALSVNESMMTIKYGKNSINAVGFKKSSGDQKAKLKSLANYNCVIIEEADEIVEEDFMQLDDSLRTIKGDITIIFLLNPPPKNHWIIRRWFDLEPTEEKDFYRPVLKPSVNDAVFLYSNYEDNRANLSQQTIKNYEAYRETKPAHYWNVIRGYVPEVAQGLIYKDWQIVDGIPHEATLLRYGLDFGFSVDPVAIIAIYAYNGGFIFDEVCYETGMKSRQIADTIKAQPEKALTVADSENPAMIAEVRDLGVNIVAADKKPGSVNFGIHKLQGERISVTRRSRNLLKERDHYCWRIDKATGDQTDDPIDRFNHGMDAARYGLCSILPDETKDKEPEEIEEVEPLYSDIGI